MAKRSSGDMNEILQGDALKVLKTLESDSMDCCVTSPPYWGLRDYGVEGQIGLEKTPQEFVRKMTEIFREVRRVLKPEGTCWLNIGDSYASFRDSKSTPDTLRGESAGTKVPVSNNRSPANLRTAGLKHKDLCGVPWRLAFALQDDGWYLRQDIIWHKPNPMPESVKDRCTKAHEYIFLLAKSERYYFDADAIKEPSMMREFRHPHGWGQGDEPRTAIALQKDGVHKKTKHAGEDKRMAGTGGGLKGHSGNRLADGTILTDRNKRSVWTVTTQPFKEAHFATFPMALIEPCILAGSPRGGGRAGSIHGLGDHRTRSHQARPGVRRY